VDGDRVHVAVQPGPDGLPRLAVPAGDAVGIRIAAGVGESTAGVERPALGLQRVDDAVDRGSGRRRAGSDLLPAAGEGRVRRSERQHDRGNGQGEREDDD
jgi:hypothetical protein